MRMFLVAASVLALAACDAAPPPQNVIEDVAANNMLADDVTEVQDDSASAPSEDVAEPTEAPNAGQADNDDARSERGSDKR